jgi:hypothetical protein
MARDPLPLVEEFKALATTEALPGVGEVMVGEDLRLYRTTRGLMTLICPAEPADKTKPALYYGGVDWDQYPEMGWLADLYDRFLSQYKREVMYVVGRQHQIVKDKCPWFFMVPKQVGTSGGIEWQDKEGMNWFLERARFLGTVHIHPGSASGASSFDLGHWTEKECSGIHVIFGRDGTFSTYGSAYGHCVHITDGTIMDMERKAAPLYTSLNRKLKKLLQVPKPTKQPMLYDPRSKRGQLKWQQSEWFKNLIGDTKFTRPHGKEEETPWEPGLYAVALMTAWDEPVLESVGDLWLVTSDGDTYLLDSADYRGYRNLCLANRWDDAPIGIRLVPDRGGNNGKVA